MAQFDEEQYYSCEFWNERYKKLAETKGFHHYDWLLTWKDLKTFLKAYLDKKKKNSDDWRRHFTHEL